MAFWNGPDGSEYLWAPHKVSTSLHGIRSRWLNEAQEALLMPIPVYTAT